MEIREFAIRILSADTMEEKLFAPESLTDHAPGAPLIFNEPVRPKGMEFTKRTKEQKLPRLSELHSPECRAVCLHRFAGHELLAVEIMAYALLAFPDAPSAFRRGVAHTLQEEQGHVKLYMNRLEGLGLHFGDLPLYKHFWLHVPYLSSPLHYLSAMSLTFEMANLDFAPMYGSAFSKVDDLQSAELMAQIVADEIRHVSFGYRWLEKLKHKSEDGWTAWLSHLSEKLEPKRARGMQFQEENRRKAGIPDAWIDNLKSLSQSSPGWVAPSQGRPSL